MAEKRILTIHKGEDRVLELGGLRFVACRREIEDMDGGRTLEVWGELDGEPVQVLRFDCFRKGPHYHVPPSAPGQIELDPSEVGDGQGFAVDAISGDVAALLAKAGFETLARSLEPGVFAAGAESLRELLSSTPEPTETSTYELDPALLG